jgi:organic hydroperoxide reductase OsmC/OhrA
MATHHASVIWQRAGDAKFIDNRYSRGHRWEFDGGAVVPASSSPAVVPLPLSDPKGVDPEEAFVASLSSCHMLWFLFYAAKGGFVVDSYNDAAEGHGEDRRRKSVDVARDSSAGRAIRRQPARRSGDGGDA